jgi:glucose-6-phosphate isomerase
VTPFTVGALIALYERAVGFYASLVNINAYHQPGVEAGKKAATAVIELQQRVRAALQEGGGQPKSAAAIATMLGANPESVYHVLVHLAANSGQVQQTSGASPTDDQFSIS